MQITKIPELKRAIANAVEDYEEKDYPIEFLFNEGMEFPDFKICVHRLEKNFFIDKNGDKWIKADDDS